MFEAALTELTIFFSVEELEQLNEKGLYAEDAELLPLIFSGEEPPAKRFIIIRDIKTIEGAETWANGSTSHLWIVQGDPTCDVCTCLEITHIRETGLSALEFLRLAMIQSTLLRWIQVSIPSPHTSILAQPPLFLGITSGFRMRIPVRKATVSEHG